MEGKRAVQLVRSRAGEFKLDPNRVGYIGFSPVQTQRAASWNVRARRSQRGRPIDRLSSRPDYLVLVYGVGRASPGESLKSFPPTFLISAAADTGGAR